MSNLTKALNLNKNLLILACAGAGKTYALTKRYITILDDFAKNSLDQPIESWQGPRNVLVITFTKKATAEMANRIYSEANKLTKGEKDTVSDEIPDFGVNIKNLAKKDSRYIPWIQREFLHSQIMTIDAFCHMVLLENPIRAGIDPGITTEDESEISELVNIAQKDFIREIAKEFDSDLKNLIDGIGLYNVRQNLTYLDNHPVEFEQVIEFFKNPDEVILKKWKDLYEPHDLPINNIINLFKEFVQTIDENEFSKKVSEPWGNFKRIIEGYKDCLLDDRTAFYAKNIHPLFITTGNQYRKSISTGNQADWKAAGLTVDEKKDFDSHLKEFFLHLSDVLPIELINRLFTSYDSRAIGIIRSLISVHAKYTKYLEKRKQQAGVLTFTDVIVKARQLLKIPAIAQKYNNRYKHILVDEFQDTNDLRWDIIRSVASGDGDLRKNGIFLVGDEKQSIYRFLSADVTVMQRAKKDLKNTESFELVEFDDNYRSSRWLIENCINPLFENILHNQGPIEANEVGKPEYEATYQKTYYPENKSEKAVAFDESVKGFFDIDILSIPYEQNEEFRKDPLYYPRHVAKSVKKILAKINNEPGWDELKGTPRIGILLRQVKSNSTLFREAFREEGVELEVVSGRGFWGRQEVMDIEAVLSFLINPLDDVAMITLLRSPIFAYDDIFLNDLLKRDRGSKSIFEFIDSEVEVIGSELADWIARSMYEPIDRLLSDIFNSNHRDLGYFSETDGRQRWVNIEKCINIIHKWSVQGMNLSDIQEKIKTRIDEGTEGDFALLPSNSDVVLMSIHQAKGLEFPIVIAPDLQRSFQHSGASSILLERLYGEDGNSQPELGITINTITGDSGSTTLIKILKEQVKREEFAENKRLLYVAVTRAKYAVLLSGYVAELKDGFPDPKQPDDARNFLDWIRNVYGINGDMIENGISSESDDAPNISIHSYKSNSKLTEVLERVILDLSTEYAQHPVYKRLSVHDLLGKVEFSVQADMLDHALGGLQFGNFIHKIFEKNWLDYSVYWEEMRTWVESSGCEFDFVNNAVQLEEYLDRLQNLPVTKKISELPTSRKITEHQISCLITADDGGRIYDLTGVIDLLYQDGDEWVVLDYKTDNNYDLKFRYENQIQIYLHLVKHIYGFEKVRGEIFYTNDRSVIPVAYQNDFLNQLEFDKITGWKLHDLQICSGKLRSDFPELKSDAIVVCPTKRWADELRMILAGQSKLLPTHKILSIGSLEELIDWGQLKKPSKFAKRLLIRKIFNNEFLGKSFYEYPGLLGSITSAFEHIEKHRLTPQKSIEKFYCEYKNTLADNKYITDISQLIIDQIDLSDRQLIIDGCIAINEQEINLYKTITNNADEVLYLPLGGELDSGFDYDLKNLSFEEIRISSDAHFHYFIPFDIEEELEVLATLILKERDNGINYQDMLIVLPTMELYVPRLLEIFKRNQIPLTLSKREPIMERPVIKAALTLLNLILNENPDWQIVRSWFSHPLGLTQIPEQSRGIFKEILNIIDINFRRVGGKKFKNIRDALYNVFENDIVNPDDQFSTAYNVWKYISDYLESIKCEDELTVGQQYQRLMGSIVDEYIPTDVMENRSVNELMKILKDLNNIIEGTGIVLPGYVFQHELIEALSGIEISTDIQDWGIQVVSVPDSTNIKREILYVPGLSQSDFPSISEGNFLIDGFIDYHDVSNRLIFQSWFENFNEVYLTCPEKNSDGKDQQPSVFLETLGSPEKIPTLLSDNNFSKKRYTVNKEIQCDLEDSFLQRQIDRHNVILLNNPAETKYFGLLGDRQQNLVERPLSATQLDELANKPLYFLMRRGWNIIETDKEISEAMQRGNLVHKILEEFGKLEPVDGWSINRSDRELAKKKMSEVFHTVMDKNQLAIESDLEVYATYYPYLLGNESDDVHGMLSEILKEDLARISDFKFAAAEQGFGYEDGWDSFQIIHPILKQVDFRGKIDRFDINDEEKIVIAVDYKTGKIDWKPVEQYRAFQLPIYYMVLKREYPDHKILITFRQLKSLKDNAYGFCSYWVGDLDDSGIVECGINRNKRHIGNTKVNELEEHILSSFTPIIDGHFRLFSEGLNSNDVNYYHLNAASRIETIKYIVETEE